METPATRFNRAMSIQTSSCSNMFQGGRRAKWLAPKKPFTSKPLTKFSFQKGTLTEQHLMTSISKSCNWKKGILSRESSTLSHFWILITWQSKMVLTGKSLFLRMPRFCWTLFKPTQERITSCRLIRRSNHHFLIPNSSHWLYWPMRVES